MALISQSNLISCIVLRALKGKDVSKDFEFMVKSPSEQWSLCRARTSETREKIIQIIIKECWPCHFRENYNFQLWFNNPLKLLSWNRIAFSIAPDTYNTVFMETALLQNSTLDFLDNFGYENQQTKEWKSLDDLIDELRRLVFIYIDLKIEEIKWFEG